MELFSLPPLFLSYFQKKYVWFFVFFCDLYSTYVLILSLNAYSSGYTKSPSTSNQKKKEPPFASLSGATALASFFSFF